MKEASEFLQALFEADSPNHKLTASQKKMLDTLIDRLEYMWEIVWDRCSTSKEVSYICACDQINLEENLRDLYSHDELMAISQITNVKTGESYVVNLVFNVSLTPID